MCFDEHIVNTKVLIMDQFLISRSSLIGQGGILSIQPSDTEEKRMRKGKIEKHLENTNGSTLSCCEGMRDSAGSRSPRYCMAV